MRKLFLIACQLAIPLFLLATIETDTALARQYWVESYQHYQDDNYDQSFFLAKKALQIYTSNGFKQHPGVERAYFLIGSYYEFKGRYILAMVYYRKRLELAKTIFALGTMEMGKAILSVANCHLLKEDYASATEHFLEALHIIQSQPIPDSYYLDMVYNNLGICYSQQGDYKKALTYFEMSLSLAIQSSGEQSLAAAQSYNNIAEVYSHLKNFGKSIPFIQKSLQIKEKLYGPRSVHLGSGFGSMARVHFRMGAFRKALAYFERRLAILEENLDSQHPFLGAAYRELAECHFRLGNLQAAFNYCESALEILRYIPGNQYDMAESFHLMGKLHQAQSSFEEALQYYDKATGQLLSQSGTRMGFKELGAPYQLIPYYYSKALLLSNQYLKGKNEDWLRKAATALDTAMEVIEFVRFQNQEYDSRQLLFEEHYPVFELAISVHKTLWELTGADHYLERAFYYCEKSKSSILFEAVKASRARSFGEVPESLIRLERQLRLDIGYYEKERFLQRNNAREPDEKLFDLKFRYENLMKKLEREFPRYYQLKYNQKVCSIGEVQKNILASGQSLLEFFVGDRSIYLFVINKNAAALHLIPRDSTVVQQLSLLLKSIPAYDRLYSRDTLLNRYMEGAYELYKKLLLPVKHSLQKKLIIVPDGILGYLPFEALLTRLPAENYTFRSHPYLLNEHQISYCYSATLLAEMSGQAKARTSRNFLAFAPGFSSNNLGPGMTTPRLDHNISEVEMIGQLWPGQVFVGTEATRSNFFREAPSSNILHLATHARADKNNGEYSFISFHALPGAENDGRLYARDLYNLRIHADMVVLSACETAAGELQRGEGIISLARGFSFAGAKSILTTLWQVHDKQSNVLMQLFYEKIQAGLPKDEALQMAKIQYIHQHRDRDAHPFFWAGFIAIGDMSPIRLLPKSFTWVYYTCAAIVLLLAALFYKFL